MFTFAAVALFSNIILPFVVYEPSPSSTAQQPIIRQLPDVISLCQLPHVSFAQGLLLSQLLQGTCMLLMAVTTNYRVGIVLGGLMGISWAMTQWVPLAIISAELSKKETIDGEMWQRNRGGGAGAVMGIYNAAISAPQVLAALASGVMFLILKAMGVTDQMRWVLGAAGLPAFAAAWLARGL
jgi:solute carrier family 45 protein 1/2/4